MNALKTFWNNHVQKSMASLLLLLDGANIAALEYYHQDVVQFFGPTHGQTVFSGIRMGLGAVIFWRAKQRKPAL